MDRLKARRQRELERKKRSKSSPPESTLKKNKRSKVSASNTGSVLKPHSHGQVITPARPTKTQEVPILVTPLPVALEGVIRTKDDESTISETFFNFGGSSPTKSKENIFVDANDNSAQASLSSDDESSAAMSGKSKSTKMTLKQAKERISALEFQVATYKNSLNTANEDVKAVEQRVKQLEEENESLRVAVEEIHAGDPVKDVLEKQAKDLGKLEATNASLRDNVTELKEMNDQKEKCVKELEGQIGDLKAKITQLLAVTKGNIHSESDPILQNKIKALEKQVTELKAQNKTLASDMKNSSKDGHVELEKAQKDVAALTRELSAKGREIKKLEQVLAEKEGLIDKLPDQESYEKLFGRYKKYKESSQKLQAKLEAAKMPKGCNAPDEELALQMEELVKANKDLELANKQLRKALDHSNNILKADGKFSKHEVRDAVKMKINAYIKKNLYHKNKFCVGKTAQKQFCESVYDALKDDAELGIGDANDKHYKPVEEFCRIYDATCRAALQSRRQYTQTQCCSAIIGTFLPCHRCLSTQISGS